MQRQKTRAGFDGSTEGLEIEDPNKPLRITHPILNDYVFDIRDMFYCVRYGDYNKLDWIINKYNVKNIFALRGF